jgi:hypothetical protein
MFNDQHAQWLAEAIERARGGKHGSSWLDLLWYNEEVKAESPDGLHRTAFFENFGMFFGRTGWSDDAVWAFFKAGPYQGHRAQSRNVYVGGHVHPDEGNFLLWAFGKWLIIEDGYVLKKRTENHNVLLFNACGQLGEGRQAFDGRAVAESGGTSRIIYRKMELRYQYLVAEIGDMYPPQAGVRHWVRTFVLLPGGLIVLRDEVDLSHSGTVRSLIHFAPGGQLKLGNRGLYRHGNTWVSVDWAPTEDLHTEQYVFKIADEERRRHTNSEGLLLATSRKNTTKAVLTYVLSVSKGKHEPTQPEIRSQGRGGLSVESKEYSAQIDFSLRQVKIIE